MYTDDARGTSILRLRITFSTMLQLLSFRKQRTVNPTRKTS